MAMESKYHLMVEQCLKKENPVSNICIALDLEQGGCYDSKSVYFDEGQSRESPRCVGDVKNSSWSGAGSCLFLASRIFLV